MPEDTAYSAWSGTGGSAPSSLSADSRLDQEFASLAPELSRRIGAILDTIQREADKLLDQARVEAQRRVDDGSREAERRVNDGRRAADGLISDSQARLARLSASLIERSEQVLAQLEETERVRQSFGRLMDALADAADRIADEARITAAIPPSPPLSAYPPSAPLGSRPLAPAPPPPPAHPPTTHEPPAPPPGLTAHAPLFASTAPPPQAPPPPAASVPAQEPPIASAPVHEPADPPAPPSPPPPPAPAEATAAPIDRAWIEARQAAIHMAAAGNTRAQVETHLRGFLDVAEPETLLDQVFGTGSDADTRVPWAIAPATPLRPRGSAPEPGGRTGQ